MSLKLVLASAAALIFVSRVLMSPALVVLGAAAIAHQQRRWILFPAISIVGLLLVNASDVRQTAGNLLQFVAALGWLLFIVLGVYAFFRVTAVPAATRYFRAT